MADGTFWIEWKDFKQQFNQVFICFDFPESYLSTLYVGAWDPSSASSKHGGCPKHPSFVNNPQYGIKLLQKTSCVIVCANRELALCR